MRSKNVPSGLRRFFTPFVLFHALILVAAFMLWGCGGGGNAGNGGGGTIPPTPSSFTVSLSSASVTLTQGGSQTIQVSVTAQNGFTGSVSVSVSGLPTGVTATPASLTVVPGTPATLILSASSSAPVAQASASVDAVSGSLNVDTVLSVAVKIAAKPFPYQSIGGYLVHGFYDPVRQLLFATNPELNELDVISPTDLSVKTRVPLPAPWGIDQMADGNTLVIGTKAQEIFTVNEDTYAVNRSPVPVSAVIDDLPWDTLFPNPIAMANGKVILIAQEYYIYSSDILDGGQALMEWDSVNDTFTQIEPLGFGAEMNSWETDSLARSADGKWAVFSGSGVYDNSRNYLGVQFYLYSSDTDSLTSAPAATVNAIPYIGDYALNADGSKIAVVSGQQVTFLDRAFNVLGTVQIPGFDPVLGSTQFSLDGRRLFLFYGGGISGQSRVGVIDANSMISLGYYGADVSTATDYSFLAVDINGQAYFGSGGGVMVANTTLPPIVVPAGGNIPGTSCPSPNPDYFPLNSSVQASLGGVAAGTTVYLGGYLATLSAGSSGGNEGLIDIPASSISGPVDMECIDPSGYTTAIPSAISYGVQVTASSANLLPAIGTPTIDLYGYGILDATFNSNPTVTVGGSTAQVVSTNSNLYLGSLQGAVVKMSQGTPGAQASITVTSANGTGTLANAVTYIPSTTIVPASGILQLLFDTHRNLLYAMKAHEVDVLNSATPEWQTPLQLPSSVTALNFGDMALSPDGTKMVIATTSQEVVVLNPDEPAHAAIVPNPSGFKDGTSGTVAITESNTALISGSTAALLDLSSLNIAPESQVTEESYLIKASADGSHIYTILCSLYSSAFATQCGGLLEVSWTDLAVSPDGSQFAAIVAPPYASGDIVVFYDSTLHDSNTNVYPDFSPPTDAGVVGATYSPQGKVLVLALGNSIEFWDTSHGTLRARLMTPEELQVIVYPETWLPVMALDSAGQTIYAVSASGLTVLKLPTPIDQMTSEQWPLSMHTSRQTGFQGVLAARIAAMKIRNIGPVAGAPGLIIAK